MRFLEEDLTAFNVLVNSPEEAIREAGNLLAQAGHVETQYIDAMIESYQMNGSYIVIAPEIAIPHARPEDGVNEASVSLVQLKNPIEFGNDANDPVYLVFAIGATNSDEHLSLLQNLINVLGDKKKVDMIKKASTYDHIKYLINGGV